jgi:hypothetical protein
MHSRVPDPPPHPETGDDGGAGLDRRSTTSRQLWIKVTLIVVIVVFVVMVGLHLAGGGVQH